MQWKLCVCGGAVEPNIYNFVPSSAHHDRFRVRQSATMVNNPVDFLWKRSKSGHLKNSLWYLRLVLPTWRTLHFSFLNFMRFLLSYLFSLSKSLWTTMCVPLWVSHSPTVSCHIQYLPVYITALQPWDAKGSTSWKGLKQLHGTGEGLGSIRLRYFLVSLNIDQTVQLSFCPSPSSSDLITKRAIIVQFGGNMLAWLLPLNSTPLWCKS